MNLLLGAICFPVLFPFAAAGFVAGAAWRSWVLGWRRAKCFHPILEAEDRLRRLVGDAVVFPDDGEETEKN